MAYVTPVPVLTSFLASLRKRQVLVDTRCLIWVAVIGLTTVTLGCQPTARPSSTDQDAGSVAPPKYGGVLAVPQTTGGDPPSFDVHQEATGDTVGPMSQAYERLLLPDPQDETKVIPDLAERWEWSADGKTITFFLRKGIKFHNGNPFTAEDVKFTLERLGNPPKGVNSLRKSLLDPVQEVTVVDPATVKVSLTRPYAALLSFLASRYMPIYDKEWVEQSGQDIPKKEVVGTGPFKLKEYIRGVSVEMARNGDYWQGGKPYLDGVKFFIILDEGTRTAAFRSGQIHVCGCGRQNVDQLAADLAGQVRTYPTPAGAGSQMTLNPSRAPFDNPRVREAIHYAIHRVDLVKVQIPEGGRPNGTFAPPWGLPSEELSKFAGYGPDQEANLAKAKQLLAEAGFANGFSTSISTRKGQSYENMSVFFENALRKVGITARLNFLESAAYFQVGATADFDLYVTSPSITGTDPDSVYAELWACNSPRNYARYCNQELETLYLKQSGTLDLAERKRLVNELEKKMLATGYKVMVGTGEGKEVAWNAVHNYFPGADHWKRTSVWLDR